MGIKWLFGVLGLVSGQAEAEAGQTEPRACALNRDPVPSLKVIRPLAFQVLQEELWSPRQQQNPGVWKPCDGPGETNPL